MNFIFLALWLFGGQSEGWRAQCVCVEQWPKAKQAPPWSLDFYRNRKCCAARVIENSGLMVGGPIISPLKAYHHFPNTSTIPRIMHRAYHFKCLRIFLNEILVEKIGKKSLKKIKSSRFCGVIFFNESAFKKWSRLYLVDEQEGFIFFASE